MREVRKNSFMANLQTFELEVIENVLNELEKRNILYFKHKIDDKDTGVYCVINEQDITQARLIVIDEIHKYNKLKNLIK